MRNPEPIGAHESIGAPTSRTTDQSAGTLLRDIDELLKYIAIVKTPEVDVVRENIERSLGMAKRELLKAIGCAHTKASVGASAHPLRVNPWAAIAAAAFLGAWFGQVLRTLTKPRRHSVR